MHGHGLLTVIMSAVLGAEAEPASLAGSSMSAQCITAVSYVLWKWLYNTIKKHFRVYSWFELNDLSRRPLLTCNLCIPIISF